MILGSASKKMKDKSKIIKFPGSRTETNTSYDEDEFLDFEAWEPYQEFLDKEDYPGLVRYCKQRAERRPNDLYAQYYLGDAYVLNGEYEKAVEFMSKHHRKHPWNTDYQYVILNALFALGKTEDHFDWSERPVILRMSADIVEACYEFLKPKRKPRSITKTYLRFVPKGYLLFTEEDLLNALLADERFIVEYPYEDSLYAEVRVARKKRK
jgi:tetratricopeptide (TPR) repeat protein